MGGHESGSAGLRRPLAFAHEYPASADLAEVYAAQMHERLERQLRRRVRELGYALTKVEVPVVPAVAEPATAT